MRHNAPCEAVIQIYVQQESSRKFQSLTDSLSVFRLSSGSGFLVPTPVDCFECLVLKPRHCCCCSVSASTAKLKLATTQSIRCIYHSHIILTLLIKYTDNTDRLQRSRNISYTCRFFKNHLFNTASGPSFTTLNQINIENSN